MVILGLQTCKSSDEIIYTNTFLNEVVELHDGNYVVEVTEAETVDSITIKDKKNEFVTKEGHFIKVNLSITQKPESKMGKHKFDTDDFKLKSHTGVYIPLNDIGSLIGWDMIDYHWDQSKNGFVISSAKFLPKKAVKDYLLLRNEIAPGEDRDLTVFFKMDDGYNVEEQIMVLEVDFRWSWTSNVKDMGEDIILLNRPDNLER